MLALASPIVDTNALWKIVLASLAAGAGVAIAFGILLIGVSRAQKTTNGGARVLDYGLAVIMGAFCVFAVVAGIHAMTVKH
ncbi:MAG: hypothetical protein JOZ07_04320 [Solirubrobacterales bacterium]|nr:hypothetical protein [Solirubrobacterales bacterium]